MIWNKKIYNSAVGINWNDIYYFDAFDNKWKLRENSQEYAKLVRKFLMMKHKGIFFIGIFSTPLLLIIWYSLRNLDKTDNIGDALNRIFHNYSKTSFYDNNLKDLKMFNRLFPILY